ncbi:MAG: T9SS type A sorting domain-containing protein, partial [Bacteroidales bacterium]|nr:T9SS type A sorting domain-containing protein [Bacteroidales bacterium]
PDKNFSFEVYPNPTMGFVTFSQYAEKVEILDNVGRLVNTVEGAINLDLSGLADGTYTLRITSQGNVVIKKVVKR